jgi:hypothetical protein
MMAFDLLSKNSALLVCLTLLLLVSSAGCAEEESDDAFLLRGIASQLWGDSNFFGIAGTIIGKVDTSVSSLGGTYYQKRGPINPDDGEYPMVLVFEPGGICKVYEDRGGDWKNHYVITLRYGVKNGLVSIRLGEVDSPNIIIALGIRDGGAVLENDDNTFVRI